MNHTSIEWATASWNPVTGCSHAGTPGCDHCYAKRMAKRLRGRYGYPADDPFRVTLHPERLDEPLHWRDPQRVFVCSMGDLLHDDVPFQYLYRVWDTMFDAAQHVYLVLTKHPQRLLFFAEYMAMHGRRIDYPNIWLGVTAETQAAADERIPLLLQTPAAKRFVSCEPLLESVDLRHLTGFFGANPLTGERVHASMNTLGQYIGDSWLGTKLDWCIVGGETGPGARPMHPDWARSLRNACQAAGLPFFFKSWGDWCPESVANSEKAARRAFYIEPNGSTRLAARGPRRTAITVQRVGKKAAGRLLDGSEWNEIPE